MKFINFWPYYFFEFTKIAPSSGKNVQNSKFSPLEGAISGNSKYP